jgi:tetratricopeptide (TPR) repeat protein
MIDTRDGTQVWRETYGRDLTTMTSVFGLYDDIAAEIGRSLGVFTAGTPTQLPTENLKAYTLLSVAAYKINETDNRMEGFKLIDRALAIDLNSAYAHYAKSYSFMSAAELGYLLARAALESAREEIAIAIALRPMPEFFLVLGFLHDRLDLDYCAAMAAYARADALGADIGVRADISQDTLLNAGLYQEGLDLSEAAEEIDPQSPNMMVNQARFLYRLGRFDEASAKFEQAL